MRNRVTLSCRVVATTDTGVMDTAADDPVQLAKLAIKVLIYARGLGPAKGIMQAQFDELAKDVEAGMLRVGAPPRGKRYENRSKRLRGAN